MVHLDAVRRCEDESAGRDHTPELANRARRVGPRARAPACRGRSRKCPSGTGSCSAGAWRSAPESSIVDSDVFARACEERPVRLRARADVEHAVTVRMPLVGRGRLGAPARRRAGRAPRTSVEARDGSRRARPGHSTLAARIGRPCRRRADHPDRKPGERVERDSRDEPEPVPHACCDEEPEQADDRLHGRRTRSARTARSASSTADPKKAARAAKPTIPRSAERLEIRVLNAPRVLGRRKGARGRVRERAGEPPRGTARSSPAPPIPASRRRRPGARRRCGGRCRRAATGGRSSRRRTRYAVSTPGPATGSPPRGRPIASSRRRARRPRRARRRPPFAARAGA